MIGIGASTDDGTNLEQGVYEFGRQDSSLPEAFNFPYVISTGTTQATTVKIGALKGIGSDLYIGWRDDSTYGVDKVAFGDNAAATGSWESLIFDNKSPDKELLPLMVIIEFEALASGESVTPKYKLDRASSFTTGTAASTVGDTRVELPIFTRANEIEIGFNLASSSGTYIKITGLIFEFDDLETERTGT